MLLIILAVAGVLATVSGGAYASAVLYFDGHTLASQAAALVTAFAGVGATGLVSAALDRRAPALTHCAPCYGPGCDACERVDAWTAEDEAMWERYRDRWCAVCADVPVEADGDLCVACQDAREDYGFGPANPVRVDAREPWSAEHECRCIPTRHRHTHEGHTQLRPYGAL